MEAIIGCGLVFVLVISLTVNMAIRNAREFQNIDKH